MIDKTFTNSEELSRGVFDPFYGKYRKNSIRSKIFSGTNIPNNLEEAYSEFSIYDPEKSLQYWNRSQNYDTENEKYVFDVKSQIEKANVPDGNGYILRYNFFKPEIGYEDNGIYVRSVSDDRREARIRVNPKPPNLFQYSFNRLFSTTPEPMKFVGNFGDNLYEHILNWKSIIRRDESGEVIFDINDNVSAKEAIIRFENPLPAGVASGDEIWIDEEVSRPYFDRFQIFRSQPVKPDNELAGPNFSVDFEEDVQPDGKFETFEEIVGGGETETSRSFIENRSFGKEVDLNIDFTKFENFVHYSSAEERIRNFQFKIKKIYQNVSKINSKGSLVYEDRLKSKVESMIASFDAYEKFLFRSEQGYPKNDSGVLKRPTRPERSEFEDINNYKDQLEEAKEVENWFSQMIEMAASYDDQNDYALRKQIPEFIKEDSENDEFVLFVDMIGHWFDVNWIYIDHLEHLSTSKENPFEPETLSSDLSDVVVESFGFETYNGFNAESFFDEIFDSEKIEGLFEDATVTDPDEIGLTRFEAQKQVWRRLLQNVVHFYKNKGNSESITSLLNIFGVPSTSLIIRESGGTPIQRDQKVKLEEESEYLSFSSSQEVELPWKNDETENPKSIELRFKTGFEGGQSLKLIEIEGVTEIRLVKDELNVSEGRIEFSVISSDGSKQTVRSQKRPIFNNEWTNLLIQPQQGGSFIDVTVQQRSPFGNKRFEENLSALVNSQTIANFYNSEAAYIGGKIDQNNRLFSEGIPFIGDVGQVNIWSELIDKSQFDKHTFFPKAYDRKEKDFVNVQQKQGFQKTDVSNLDSIREQLIFRGEFSSNNPQEIKNLSSKAEVENLKGSLRIEGEYESYTRINFVLPIQVGNTSFIKNKIKTFGKRDNSEFRLNKSTVSKVERQISEDGIKLGAFLSPNTSINRDVISETGISSINKLLGNPNDQFRDNYYTLDAVNRLYWQKINEPRKDIQTYISYVDQFYNALFKHIEKTFPARSSSSSGILIEPTILERERNSIPTGSITDNT